MEPPGGCVHGEVRGFKGKGTRLPPSGLAGLEALWGGRPRSGEGEGCLGVISVCVSLNNLFNPTLAFSTRLKILATAHGPRPNPRAAPTLSGLCSPHSTPLWEPKSARVSCGCCHKPLWTSWVKTTKVACQFCGSAPRATSPYYNHIVGRTRSFPSAGSVSMAAH